MPTGVYIRTKKLGGWKHSEEWKKRRSEKYLGKGNPFYGKKHSEKTCLHLSTVRRGKKWTEYKRNKIMASIPREENHYAWKGEEVQYRALHSWIERRLGKPRKCELCETNNLRHRQYHWANISGRYLRELTDWMRLCVKCHIAYDRSLI